MSPLMACSLVLAFQQTTEVVRERGRGGSERPAAGVWGDIRASEGSERSQLTFKQGRQDHP